MLSKTVNIFHRVVRLANSTLKLMISKYKEDKVHLVFNLEKNKFINRQFVRFQIVQFSLLKSTTSNVMFAKMDLFLRRNKRFVRVSKVNVNC